MSLSLEPRALSWHPWSPHLEPPPVSTKDSRQQLPGPSGSKEEGVSSPGSPGHLYRSAVAMGCQEENLILQDTQHQQPRPQQALGDKGPQLSSVEPGTGISPPISHSQLALLSGQRRAWDERRKKGLSFAPLSTCLTFLLHRPLPLILEAPVSGWCVFIFSVGSPREGRELAQSHGEQAGRGAQRA